MNYTDIATWNWAEWTLFAIAFDLAQLLALSLFALGAGTIYRWIKDR